MARILVLYYSATGHTQQLAMAVAHGARSIPAAQVDIARVPGLFTEDYESNQAYSEKIPLAKVDDLPRYDAIVIGSPVRLGSVGAEMRHFWDQSAKLWQIGALIGKVGSVFVTTASQHGGHEAAILSMHHTLLHHGMIIVGLPASEPGLLTMSEISGGSPYGAGTISALDGLRQPSDNEFDLAEAQGKRVATVAIRLYG